MSNLAPVLVYTKPDCPGCKFTKAKLEKHGIPYEAHDVTERPEAAARVKELGYQQLPVVECGPDHWSGYKPDHLAALANRPSL